MKSRKLWIIALACLVVGAAAGNPTRRRERFYTPHDRAYFLPESVEFVNPGLKIAVQSAAIAADGTITVTYAVSDPTGLPLDKGGVTTPGTISLSFLAAAIPHGQEQYVSYTTRTATGTVIPSTTQAAADSGGTTTPGGPGQYTYTFKTKAAGFDPTATNTIGIYGSRNLTAFNLGTDYASTTFNFVPNGSKVVTTRDVIRDASCNRCHDQLSFHGGSRRGIALCVMCHTPQNHRSEHRKHARSESHGAQDPYGFVVAQRDRREALPVRGFPEPHFRLLGCGGPGHGAALHGLPRPDHGRGAGNRLSDRAHPGHLRLLPRRCQLRDRRESPGGRIPGRQQVLDLPCSAGRIGFRRLHRRRACGPHRVFAAFGA